MGATLPLARPTRQEVGTTTGNGTNQVALCTLASAAKVSAIDLYNRCRASADNEVVIMLALVLFTMRSDSNPITYFT